MYKEKKLIAVCGARVFEQIAMQFINTLREISLEDEYYPIAFSSYSYFDIDNDSSVGEANLFELVTHIKLSGLVILAETLKNQQMIQRIIQIGHTKNIPVFLVDGKADGCYNLVMDYNNGFEQMVQHVIRKHGCRRINMLAGFHRNTFSEERVAIYKKVLAENGIPFEENRLEYGDFWERPTEKAMHRFLDSGAPLPDAIVCANDAMATTACSVLDSKGLQVPEDIIVTGFDGTKDARLHFPAITTGEPDYQSAAKFIISKIKEAEKSHKINPSDFLIKFRIIPSQSCGCQPKVYHKINSTLSSLSRDIGDCAWHNIAMSNMIDSVLDKKNIMDIAKIIPNYVRLWSDCFRFACVKSSLITSCDADDNCTEMTTILRDNSGVFEKPGETFCFPEILPRIDEVLKKDSNVDTLVVRLLNSGKNVYGYVIEGFQAMDDRRLQRCNEFALFLTNAINTVIHNYKVTRLNENLSKAYEKISNLYLLDSMTEIYNRRGFFQNLTEAVRNPENSGKYLYLYSIDMDGLKHINDVYGHKEGDFAIITLANAIVNISGKEAICSRFGGDEFTCAIFTNPENACPIKQYEQKLQTAISQSENVDRKPYQITASVGMTFEQVTENMDIDSMLLTSDHLMYQDKIARKKNRISS